MTDYREKSSFKVPLEPDDGSNVAGYGFTPPPKDVLEKRNLRYTGNMIGFAVVISFGLMSLVPSLLFSTFRLLLGDAIQTNAVILQLLNILSYIICLMLPALLYALVMKFPIFSGISYARPQLKLAFPAMLIALGVSMVGTTFSSMLSEVFSWFHLVPTMPNFSAPADNGLATFLYILNIAILPPLVEEFIFRGVLMQTLRKFGDGFALLVSAVIFAVMHRNFIQGPNAFLMGLVLGYFVMYTGTIWTGVLMHFINNGLSVVITLLTPLFSVQVATVFQNVIYLLYLSGGIIATMYLTKRYRNIFTLRHSKTALQGMQKCKALFLTFGMLLAAVVCVALTARYFQFLF